MTGSPVLFRPSLVARVAYIGFGFGFLNQGGSDEFAEIVRTCTNISALHLDCYPDVTAAELQGYFADGLRLRHLVLGSGDGLILRISQSDWRAWFANLTHLELDNSRFCQPITLRDIPSLTHLLVQSMMGDYSEMKMSHLTPHIDSLPRSVRFFALVLVSGANSKIPFVNDALAESILALHHPAVVLGTRDRVTPIQSDSPHRKHFILDFANQYTWKHGRFVRWEYGDSLWTMIEDMVENRKALPLLVRLLAW